jgi:hypothetical protein
MIETIQHEIGVLGVNEGVEDAGCGDGARMCHALLTITYFRRAGGALRNCFEAKMRLASVRYILPAYPVIFF